MFNGGTFASLFGQGRWLRRGFFDRGRWSFVEMVIDIEQDNLIFFYWLFLGKLSLNFDWYTEFLLEKFLQWLYFCLYIHLLTQFDFAFDHNEYHVLKKPRVIYQIEYLLFCSITNLQTIDFFSKVFKHLFVLDSLICCQWCVQFWVVYDFFEWLELL